MSRKSKDILFAIGIVTAMLLLFLLPAIGKMHWVRFVAPNFIAYMAILTLLDVVLASRRT